MQVVKNRSGRVVAIFCHNSDLLLYLEQNKQCAYETVDEPGLDATIAETLNTPLVDASWRRQPWVG
jgi:hypothetical protein